jgi:phage FluMu protein Com
MRCPECNKFVSYEDPPEAEEQSTEIGFDDEGNEGKVEGLIRIVLRCADCSTELRDADIDYEQTFEHECKGEEVGDWSAEFDSAEGFSRLEDTDSRGKKIRSVRYMKTFYGADVSISAVCPKCGETVQIDVRVEEQASSFNECA